MKSLKEGDVGKRRKGMAEILQGCWRSCADSSEASDDVKPFIANAIIANPPSFAHIVRQIPFDLALFTSFEFSALQIQEPRDMLTPLQHCAEKLGIPLHLMFT